MLSKSHRKSEHVGSFFAGLGPTTVAAFGRFWPLQKRSHSLFSYGMAATGRFNRTSFNTSAPQLWVQGRALVAALGSVTFLLFSSHSVFILLTKHLRICAFLQRAQLRKVTKCDGMLQISRFSEGVSLANPLRLGSVLSLRKGHALAAETTLRSRLAPLCGSRAMPWRRDYPAVEPCSFIRYSAASVSTTSGGKGLAPPSSRE